MGSRYQPPGADAQLELVDRAWVVALWLTPRYRPSGSVHTAPARANQAKANFAAPMQCRAARWSIF